MKKLIAGNWKMNGDKDFAGNLTETLVRFLPDYQEALKKCDVLLCPPFLHLGIVQDVIHAQGAPVFLGAQNCCERDNGAVTGEVSAQMLADFGCSYVILGHSERREYYGESDDLVAAKAKKAHEAGLTAIICVGEKEEERMAGHQEKIVGRQLEKSLPDTARADNTVLAYEPVWAIGTGKTATAADVKTMHSFIRKKLQERLEDSELIRILYGGSMKPENAAELLATPNVDGGLIGGASLKAEQFLGIVNAV